MTRVLNLGLQGLERQGLRGWGFLFDSPDFVFIFCHSSQKSVQSRLHFSHVSM